LKKISLVSFLFLSLILLNGCDYNPNTMMVHKETSPQEMYGSLSEFVSVALGYNPTNNETLERWPADKSRVSFYGVVKNVKITNGSRVTNEKVEIKNWLRMAISPTITSVKIRLEKAARVLTFRQPFEINVTQEIRSATAYSLNANVLQDNRFSFLGQVENIQFPVIYGDHMRLDHSATQVGYLLEFLIENSPTFEKLVLESETGKPFLLSSQERTAVLKEADLESKDDLWSLRKRYLLNFLSEDKNDRYPIIIHLRLYEIAGNTIE